MIQTTDITAITLKGTEYTMSLTPIMVKNTSLYEITGKRGASAALIVRTDGAHPGVPIIAGASNLERMSCWEIANATRHLIPEISI
jgi:hypothetical protein